MAELNKLGHIHMAEYHTLVEYCELCSKMEK